MADKIVVMRDGVVEQAGHPLDLYDNPVNLFVASFIGSPAMNFLNGKVEARNGGPVFVTEQGIALPVPDKLPANLADRRLVYGVRPEHILLADDSDGDAVTAGIDVVEPTGSETQVFLRFGTDPVAAVFRDRIDGRPGSQIRLRPNLANVHFFDHESGRRIAL